MANPSEVEAQVRFALSQLPVHNAHHEFEHICRRLTEQFICSNVLPATGPVSAGGDQGRDFETFRSYLREELGPHGAFLGLVSEGTIAFICTIQADDLPTKLRRDIKKICASGHPVHEIRAFTLESVTVSSRHDLQTETWDLYQITLEFHDAESVSNLLARPEGFWIAERFLSIPSEIRPEATDVDDDRSAEYVERRRNWREKGLPNPTIGDFIDLKTGLRKAVFHKDARGDLPFWLGLIRQMLANPDLPAPLQQRARYELVVATFRGTNDFRPVDDVAHAYLTESLRETEPARLQDASALLMYANTAVRAGLSSLTPSNLGDWNTLLTKHIHELATHETPHRRASLLYALGHLGLHPVLTETDIQDSSVEVGTLGQMDLDVGPASLANVSLPEDLLLVDVSRTLSAWSDLVKNLKETPLFPIKGLADIIQLLVPLWSTQSEWRELLDLVDEAVEQRFGKSVLAGRARDRAMKLLSAKRHLDALEELHAAKIDWWSGETVRASLLAMSVIAQLYLKLGLPQASKSYALAVAFIAHSKRDEDLTDLIPAALFIAAGADFVSGAWFSATELYELALLAQDEFIKDGLNSENSHAVEDAVLKLPYINACAKIVNPDSSAWVEATIFRIGVQEIIEGTRDFLDAKDSDYWQSFGDRTLMSRPFSDVGEVRHIRFSALGTEWNLIAKNDIETVRAAERFAAAAQVVIAALAREDMCFIQTRINVRIVNTPEVKTPVQERIESLPSNDGREWVVKLTPVRRSDDVNPDDIVTELLAMLSVILRETSLLPEDDFVASLERAFERGLGHKLSPGRPFDQLLEMFANDTEPELQRSLYTTPWNCDNGILETHEELRWQDGPGPTYSKDLSEQILRTRYESLAESIRITIAMLAASKEFRSDVKALRAEGWLDWHILVAIANIVMNYRNPYDPSDYFSETTRMELIRLASQPESATVEPVPIGLFTLDTMNLNRQFAMMSLVNNWGLECQQRTPDLPAIQSLLAARYGYWVDDVPHDDPFPESGGRERNDGLVVLKDS